ncbi:hypothetical protein KM043_013603 [Ampulex compressa]|nr:hypothetical protein KM043_013603 [Ampulex compressa]
MGRKETGSRSEAVEGGGAGRNRRAASRGEVGWGPQDDEGEGGDNRDRVEGRVDGKVGLSGGGGEGCKREGIVRRIAKGAKVQRELL